MRGRVGRWAMAIAAALGLSTPPVQPVQQTSNSAAAAGQQRDQSPATPASTVAAQQQLGFITAPDFRSWRQQVPVWVGRPRSRHGRQYGPRV